MPRFAVHLGILFAVFALSGCSDSRPIGGVAPDRRSDLSERFVNSIGMPMIRVRGGTFLMGTDKDPSGMGYGFSYGPRHEVSVSDFYLAKHEVTKGAFRQFVAETGIGSDLPELDPTAITEDRKNYDRHFAFALAPGDEYPIYRCDWYTAVKFCDWLSKKEGMTYRLPREAEWEFAARAGVDAVQWWYGDGKKNRVPLDTYVAHGDEIGDTAYGNGCAPPGAFPANPWGFYDMLGNAPEWCMDWYAEKYDTKLQHDPTGPRGGDFKIVRGGGVESMGTAVNVFFQGPGVPDSRQGGIRLVCVIDQRFSPPSPPKEPDPPQPAPVHSLPSISVPIAEGVPLDLLIVPAGTVLIGSPVTERGRGYRNEGPQTQADILHAFLLGRFEVTQRQYESVMGINPSLFKGTDHPVECVSRPDVIAFCKRLTEAERQAGRIPADGEYRLPTEAEWEYVSRAGTAGAFSFGDDPTSLRWYGVYDVLGGPRPVGQKWANPWGFFDMYGNVQEMCETLLGLYPGGHVIDPFRMQGRAGTYWVCRGGSWNTDWVACRSAARRAIWYNVEDADRCEFIGFRVARTLGVTEQQEMKAKGLLGPDTK